MANHSVVVMLSAMDIFLMHDVLFLYLIAGNPLPKLFVLV